jgi:peptidyl-prolyl cis-trans isomerase B (cyclophilin B)
MGFRLWRMGVLCLFAACAAASVNGAFEQAGGLASIVAVETTKGTFAFATFPNDAPATVEHVLTLIRARFYDGQRVHRALPGFVVQFGDPQTRDQDKRELWGRGGAAASGKPIGVAEITKKRMHKKGAVAMAHMGNPANADSQIYVTLEDRPDLDGRYAVFGQVTEGDDVPAMLEVGDLITRVYVRP